MVRLWWKPVILCWIWSFHWLIRRLGWLSHLASHSPLNPRVNNAVGSNSTCWIHLVVDVSKSRVGKSNMCDQMWRQVDHTMWVKRSVIQPCKFSKMDVRPNCNFLQGKNCVTNTKKSKVKTLATADPWIHPWWFTWFTSKSLPLAWRYQTQDKWSYKDSFYMRSGKHIQHKCYIICWCW